jgi:hypothetical protein
VQTSIALLIPMKQITVVLQQDFKTVGLVVSDSAEDRCATKLVWSLYQIVIYAEFAQDLRHLVMTVGNCLV